MDRCGFFSALVRGGDAWGISHQISTSFYYSLRSVCCNTADFDLCGLRAGTREREGTKGVRFAARLHCFILFVLS